MIHELKCWPDSYGPVADGVKHAEFRLDDRGYRVGDTLLLREWHPGRGGGEAGYTGRQMEVMVTHVLHGPMFGVPDQYCMLSFRRKS